MIEIAFSSSFDRAFKKKVKNDKKLEERFWEKLQVFIDEPFEQSLRTHKLSGDLSGLWSFSLGYDLRVVFSFEENERAVLIDIGTHDEVY